MQPIMHYGVQTPVLPTKTQPDPLETPKNGILNVPAKPERGRPKRTDEERSALSDRELAAQYQKTQPSHIEERREEGDIL